MSADPHVPVDLLTDIPEFARAQFGVECEEVATESLPEEIAGVWQALAGPGSIRAHRGRNHAAGSEGLLVVLDEPPRSQFDSLRALWGTTGPVPAVVAALARRGTDFRGNRSRAWAGEAGNLHLSVMLREPMEAGRVGAALSMLPVVVAAELLDAHLPSGLTPEIKWVNDVLVGGRKIAGLLTASSIRGNRLEAGLFGVGINVGAVPEVPPTAFVPGVTALREWTEGPLPGIGTLTREVVAGLARGLREIAETGPGEVLAAYRRMAGGIGREVTIWPDETDDTEGVSPLASGRLQEIGDDLSLRLEGHPEPLFRGRMAYRGGGSTPAEEKSGPG